MINHDLSVNKLIILYLLEKVEMPMTNTQLSEFIIDKGYTNYFSFQEFIYQLIEDELIRTMSSSKTTSYIITESGRTTLGFFSNRISDSIREDIDGYLVENKYDIKQQQEILSEYIPEKDGDYLVHLTAKENGKILLDLTINVFSKDYARRICDRWQEESHVYLKNIMSLMMDSLLDSNEEPPLE